jgi:hypothetical protein
MNKGTRIKTINQYVHRPAAPGSAQEADTAPGPYYVSVRDAGRTGLLLGPFETHQEALDLVDDGRAKANDVSPFSAFFAFGTVRMPAPFREPGVLNRFFPQLQYMK